MDAGVQALGAHLDEVWDAFLRDAAGVEETVFHWTPGPEFNSVAILLRHLAGSERYWIGEAILLRHLAGSERYWIGEAIGGIPSQREREKEFAHDRPRREDVLRAVDEARRVTRQVLAPLTMADLQADAAPSTARGTPPRPKTKVWALLHYIEHLGYHRGQGLLLVKLARTAPREAASR